MMIICSTKVVHCKKEPYDVYIGRAVSGLKGSIWANPFKIGPDGDRDEVIEKYHKYILSKPELLAQLESLRGKTLGCWCSPQKCHGHVLIELLGQQQQTGLGQCAKCGDMATLKSPSGTVYCSRCGRCQRRVYGTMRGVVVLRQGGECKRTVEEFVMHPRMGIWCCPCVLEFEEKMSKE